MSIQSFRSRSLTNLDFVNLARQPVVQFLVIGVLLALVLHREALAMGLDQNDPVVRRVLVQKLEQIAKNLIELSLTPTDQDLEQCYAMNSERYRPPHLITFTHVFIHLDRRGDRTLQDAAEILADLQSREKPTEGIETSGDPFMLQRYYPEKNRQIVASTFSASTHGAHCHAWSRCRNPSRLPGSV